MVKCKLCYSKIFEKNHHSTVLCALKKSVFVGDEAKVKLISNLVCTKH